MFFLDIFTANLKSELNIQLVLISIDCANEFLVLVLLFSLVSLDDKDQKKSQKVLTELENIDDECDQNDIAFVKIDDDNEAAEWGIDEIPTIVNTGRISILTNVLTWTILIVGILWARYSTHLRRGFDEGRRFTRVAHPSEAPFRNPRSHRWNERQTRRKHQIFGRYFL